MGIRERTWFLGETKESKALLDRGGVPFEHRTVAFALEYDNLEISLRDKLFEDQPALHGGEFRIAHVHRKKHEKFFLHTDDRLDLRSAPRTCFETRDSTSTAIPEPRVPSMRAGLPGSLPRRSYPTPHKTRHQLHEALAFHNPRGNPWVCGLQRFDQSDLFLVSFTCTPIRFHCRLLNMGDVVFGHSVVTQAVHYP